jgi:hypothetical protein
VEEFGQALFVFKLQSNAMVIERELVVKASDCGLDLSVLKVGQGRQNHCFRSSNCNFTHLNLPFLVHSAARIFRAVWDVMIAIMKSFHRNNTGSAFSPRSTALCGSRGGTGFSNRGLPFVGGHRDSPFFH